MGSVVDLCVVSVMKMTFYRDSKASYPDLGDEIETKDGTGQVVAIDVIAGTIKVLFEKGVRP